MFILRVKYTPTTTNNFTLKKTVIVPPIVATGSSTTLAKFQAVCMYDLFKTIVIDKLSLVKRH